MSLLEPEVQGNGRGVMVCSQPRCVNIAPGNLTVAALVVGPDGSISREWLSNLLRLR